MLLFFPPLRATLLSIETCFFVIIWYIIFSKVKKKKWFSFYHLLQMYNLVKILSYGKESRRNDVWWYHGWIFTRFSWKTVTSIGHWFDLTGYFRDRGGYHEHADGEIIICKVAFEKNIRVILKDRFSFPSDYCRWIV